MSQRSPGRRPRAGLVGLVGGFAIFLGAITSWSAASIVRPVQDEPEAGEPIEVVVVQGFVKSIDEKNLVLTAPGAPHDLPLLLHPETRYVDGSKDVAREDVHEGQLVRAALIPSADGSDLLAIVVEIVPAEEKAPAAPPGDPGNLGEPMPRFDGKAEQGNTKI